MLTSIPHDIILIGGFIAVECVFGRIEHAFRQHEEKLRRVRHGTLVIWAFNPSVTNAVAHWADHAWTVVLATSSTIGH